MRLHIAIVKERIDVPAAIAEVIGTGDGAIATFTGIVRDHHGGRPVDHLEYHAYAEMAQEELGRIASDLARGSAVDGIALVHRVGRLAVGEASVLVAAAAPHRKDALACCAAGIEEIKKRLPVWKKEFFADGGEPLWVFGPDETCRGGGEGPEGKAHA
jgi:molybdopterin synthase catalytic subunit